MKVKILSSKSRMWWYYKLIGSEIYVNYFIDDSIDRYHHPVDKLATINTNDAVITELPESFCVKRCDDKEKWKKYIQWLRNKYVRDLYGFINKYYGVRDNYTFGKDVIFGTEIHIDDMIKHIDYLERHIKGGEEFHKESQLTVKMDKEFDLTTNEGRLAYARKYYPIGTKYIPLSNFGGEEVNSINAEFEPRIWVSARGINNGIEVSKMGLIYHEGTNRWAEIIKEEVNMETQKLSRIGLEEIHSVACTSWKKTLVDWAKNRNIFKEYIELSQEEVNKMFDACTKEQLPIVSKYLKQDDGSIDVTKFNVSGKGFCDDNFYIIRDREHGEYKRKSFLISEQYNWEIKKDKLGQLCLIPTKKK